MSASYPEPKSCIPLDTIGPAYPRQRVAQPLGRAVVEGYLDESNLALCFHNDGRALDCPTDYCRARRSCGGQEGIYTAPLSILDDVVPVPLLSGPEALCSRQGIQSERWRGESRENYFLGNYRFKVRGRLSSRRQPTVNLRCSDPRGSQNLGFALAFISPTTTEKVRDPFSAQAIS